MQKFFRKVNLSQPFEISWRYMATKVKNCKALMGNYIFFVYRLKRVQEWPRRPINVTLDQILFDIWTNCV
jgi:hypothetical protein